MTELVFRMADIGEGVTEAEIIAWHVAAGDSVEADDVLVEVMTDKASIEIPSPVSGVVRWIGPPAGESISIGAELVIFEIIGTEAEHQPLESSDSRGLGFASEDGGPTRSSAEFETPGLRREDSGPNRALASPAVRRHAWESGIDIASVHGSGPGGRVEHQDVEQVVTMSAPCTQELTEDVHDIAVTGLRRQIAERITRAVSHIAHFTFVEEVEVEELESLRRELNVGVAEDRRLTLLPLIVRSVVCAVAKHPLMNATFDDEAGVIRQYRSVHVGMATQTDKGLLVPVIRNAEVLSLWECSSEMRRLASRARAGTLKHEELAGSTITISSLGKAGGIATTPIINYPEVAIIGVNRIQIRSVWDGVQFVPRRMMNLSSSFDHRVVDGADAAEFVGAIKRYLEHPALMYVDH